MPITLEFFGIPRRRAGIPALTTEARTLAQALQSAASQLPHFAADCLSGSSLKNGCLANINGTRFTADPNTPLADGDVVLILSADVGG